MAFKFQLETLLRIRKRMEEAMEMELASLLMKRARLKKDLENEQARLIGARSDLGQRMRKGIMSEEFHLRWQLMMQAEEKCRDLARQLRKAELDVASARVELAQRHTDTELVETLRERELKSYLQEVDRALQRELDDLASLRHSRLRSNIK
jgi:flagellar export protein FliJ